jgi:transcriptional regulator with XRE-family HTH domain
MNNEDQNASEVLARVFREELRNARKELGLSQEALGFESGYHRTYISLLERGLRAPSLQTTFRLSTALGITPSEFIARIQRRIEAQDVSRSQERKEKR